MYAFIHAAEAVLAPLFKGLPSLPQNARLALAKLWPILALVFGILQIVAVIGLWGLGRTADSLVTSANELSTAYGYNTTQELGLFYWLSLVVLVVDAVILLLAASKLTKRNKQGWDLLFLGGLLNAGFAVVALFDAAYGGFGSFLSSLLGSAIGFYLLFQTREYYVTAGKSTKSAAAKKS